MKTYLGKMRRNEALFDVIFAILVRQMGKWTEGLRNFHCSIPSSFIIFMFSPDFCIRISGIFLYILAVNDYFLAMENRNELCISNFSE